MAERLKRALEELGEWTRGERALRTTQIVDGEFIRHWEAGPEFHARQAESDNPR